MYDRNDYNSKLVSAAEAVSHIHDGDRIMCGHIVSEPLDVLDALFDHYEQYHDVEITTALSYGAARYADPKVAEHIRYISFFASAKNKNFIRDGYAEYVPLSLRDMQSCFRRGGRRVDVAMMLATPPDENGFINLGVSSDFTLEIIKDARTVIVECTPSMPYTGGETLVPLSDIDYIVESSRSLPELPVHTADAEDIAIAKNVAALIEDGSTVQVGVGVIPNAVMSLVKEKKDLGIHTEVLSDWCVDLVESGALTGRRKTLHPGKIVATSVLGTRRIYDFIDHHPDVLILQTEYVNDPAVIAQNSRMVCVNGCVEVDLLGQIAAESADGYQLSGSGGQLNFAEGANYAADGKGKAIFTLKSCYTDKNGIRHSRILPYLKPYTVVTTPRNLVDYVVTEYGAAHLKYKTAHERARALIAIAHPDFREELTKAYEAQFHITL